ncbi:MAG: hypothetical protein EBU54_09120 [Mycobacteriaceae bacterium]|nr:hypothetical protein [Mycobacteriaceae bacterium]
MRRAARIDTTAPALIAYAKSIGFTYLPINGVVDGILVLGGFRAAVVDWKSIKGTLTDAQAKLVASGFPIRFVSSPEQLDFLKVEMSR